MAENEGHKMTNLTMTDHFSKHENAEHENNGPICETWKYTGRENV